MARLESTLRFFASLPFYLPFNRAFFSRKAPAFPRIQPRKLWPGDVAQGNRLTKGHFRFSGRQVNMAESTWYPVEVGENWLHRLHTFNWLDDLRVSSDQKALTTARALILRWIEDHGRLRPKSWGAVTMATRLTQWMAHFEYLSSTADPRLQRTILRSTMQQYACLARLVPGNLEGSALIRSLKALIIVGRCLPGTDATVARATGHLKEALAAQILADGSHIERCPATQMRVLLDLLDIRTAFSLAEVPAPDWLTQALHRCAGFVRLLQHGDGRLAKFQGEALLSARLIQEALQRADGGQTPLPSSGGPSGFHRIKAGRSLLIVDAGTAPKVPANSGIHASTLAFEFSIGQVRLVTNCGSFNLDWDWRQLQRSTAAHSTLTWADYNSSELRPNGTVGRTPTQISAQRQRLNDPSGTYDALSLNHNGYASLGGGIHYRGLSLRTDGLVLLGEDRLEGAEHDNHLLRFHLHPGVQAELTQTRRSAILRLSTRDQGWRFDALGAHLQIADSVVADERGQPLRAQQLVLAPNYTGLAPKDHAMRWQFYQQGAI